MAYQSDLEYMKRKTYIPVSCPKSGIDSHLCGECFWTGVVMKPEHAVKYKCTNCTDDMKLFKEDITTNSQSKSPKRTLEYKPLCSIHCIWWDWFDYLRQQFAKQNNTKINYTWNKHSKDDGKSRKKISPLKK